MDAEDKAYRETVQKMERESQTLYDKAVLTLSGGAFYVSFSFVSEFIKDGNIQACWLLGFAWVGWVLSMLLILLSFLFSTRALRQTVHQFDEDSEERKQNLKCLGGIWTLLTQCCNWGSCLSFISGVVLMCIFAFKNMG